MSSQPRILQRLEDLRDTTASIDFVPDLFMAGLIQARMDNLGGVPVVAVCETPFAGIDAVVKQAFDFAAAALILVLIAPRMLAIAIAVKATSAGSASIAMAWMGSASCGSPRWTRLPQFINVLQERMMKRRIDYNLVYLRRRSFGLDLRIILRTIGLVCKDPSAY